MKKVLTVLSLCLLCMTVSAQSEEGENQKKKDDTKENTVTGNGLKSGNRNIIEFGGGLGIEDDRKNISINLTMGHQFSPYFFIGLGIGGHLHTNFLYYNNGIYTGKDNMFALPIFLNLRADFANNRITPFFDTKMGYSPVDLSGFYGSFSLGARFRIKNKHNLSLSTGVETQDSNIKLATDCFLRLGVDF